MAKTFTVTNPSRDPTKTSGSIRIEERIPPGELVEITILDEYSEDFFAAGLRTDGFPSVTQTEPLKLGETRSPLTDKLEFDFSSLSQTLINDHTVLLKFKMPSRPTTIQVSLEHNEARYSGSAGGSGGVRLAGKSRALTVTVFPE